VRNDQVLAATGVPIAGDPGWARVSRTGAPYLAGNAYGEAPPARNETVPAGSRAVRWLAKDVHHFAWSASPDYIYEGTVAVRRFPAMRFQTWDTVAVHVLYKPGDDTTWGRRVAVDRTVFALGWLEELWGPYAYPQITNVHRLDGGGTEFPMLIMDGSASQGLILHELGHVFTYGILANNEWRSGWLDEGLTDYQTYWAQNLTPQEINVDAIAPPRLPEGYRVNAVTIPRADSTGLAAWKLDLIGRTEPIGTMAAEFREFGIYNAMIYDRARAMYGHLRDVMGDDRFREFLHDYYARWALRHVDERAMRAAAERAYGGSLAWFFDQWVHGTGLLDYGLGFVSTTAAPGNRWVTRAEVIRYGELQHPMPVGVRTARGWTIVNAPFAPDLQMVEIVTDAPVIDVQLDPRHVTGDWDWRNNYQSSRLGTIPAPRVTFAWPGLDQSDRWRTIVALAPALWYTEPQGMIVGIRARTNYLTSVDRHDGGIAFATQRPLDSAGFRLSSMSRLQFWARAANVTLPWFERPLMGYSAGVAHVDGITKVDAAKEWDLSPFIFARGPSIGANAYFTGAYPGSLELLPEQWDPAHVTELGGAASFVTAPTADSAGFRVRASVGTGIAAGTSSVVGQPTRGYVRGEVSLSAVQPLIPDERVVSLRLFGGYSGNAPRQRAVFASSLNPFVTFDNDYYRGRRAVLKQDGVNYLPLGGAGLRGFDRFLALDQVVAVNAGLAQKFIGASGAWGRGAIWANVFGDVGMGSSRTTPLADNFLADAGVGIVARGTFYDRPITIRLDLPVFVNHAGFAGGTGLGGSGSVAARWVVSFGDLR
jgi:hypothetical protein